MSNIRDLIDHSRVTATQYAVIAICVILNMLDGMDVVVISYAATAVAADLGIESSTLGIVFSAGLVGMTMGSAFLAPWADEMGRRKMIMLCVSVIGGGVLLTAAAQTVWQLVLLRFVSGLGIGAMLASTVTLASEYAPERLRNFVVSIVLTGYPIGATLSGFAAAKIVPDYGWRAMFVVAAVTTTAILPFTILWLGESWEWLIKRQPVNALQLVNRVLSKMGHAPLNEIPAMTQEAKGIPIAALFKHGRAGSTIRLWIAFFCGFATLYFLLTWIPNLAENTGLSTELAIYSATVMNLGAVIGNLIIGYISQTIGLKRSIVLFYGAAAGLMAVFGLFHGNAVIMIAFGLIGFSSQGGLVGLYAVGARLYPAEARNTGIGWAVGMGRIGAILSPAVGGLLVAAGFTLAKSLIVFAAPLLVACVAVWVIKAEEIS